jgi:hypothetical protein
MRIRYRDIEFRAERAERIVQMNSILAEYNGRVSVRQLYYRLVAAGLIANTALEYSKIQGLITDARYAGLIDWDAIEDRNRAPERPQDWADGSAILDASASAFRLDRWKDQPFYTEVWVEKAALAGVLAPIASDYHVTLMVNRGYSSASAMKESADRIRGACRPQGGIGSGGVMPRPVVLYIGDHDPSGEDMVRDVRDRLVEFGCPEWLDVRKLALTMAQIEEYDPPSNPAKVTDSRAAAYIAKHGEYSWEVDALPPKALDALLRKTLNAYIDKPKMDAVIGEENKIKARIKQFAQSFKG